MEVQPTIARPIIALSFVLAWNVAGTQRDAVVAVQSAANRTITGEFIVDPPTLINLGFEWFIQGDDNRNASVAVVYRKQGAAQWNAALPLLRLQGERISANDRMDVISPIMFAGSILELGSISQRARGIYQGTAPRVVTPGEKLTSTAFDGLTNA